MNALHINNYNVNIKEHICVIGLGTDTRQICLYNMAYLHNMQCRKISVMEFFQFINYKTVIISELLTLIKFYLNICLIDSC